MSGGSSVFSSVRPSSPTTGTSSTPLSAISLSTSSASSSVSPSTTINTLYATPTASNVSSPSPVSSLAAAYDSGTDSFPPSTASITSESSPQSTSNSPVDVSATPTSSNDLIHSSLVASQNSFNPQTYVSSVQTSTAIGSVGAWSQALLPVTASTARSTSVPLSTSTEVPTQLGSALATYTQLGTTSSSNSFFNNRGAVVGTFVAVAIFSTAVFALCVVWRHRLKRRRRDKMLRVTPPGLQHGPHDQSTMSMISDANTFFTPTYRNDTPLHGIGAGAMITTSVSPPVKGSTINKMRPKYDSPFSNYSAIDYTSGGLTGLAVTTNPRIDSPIPSLAPSTPSIYPPSLPPEVNDATVYHSPFSPPSINPPPRPPRRRPPPRPRDITEAAVVHPSQTTSVSLAANLSLSCTTDSFFPHTPATDATDKLAKLSEESRLLTPSLSMSDHSQTDTHSCSTSSAAPMLDHPTKAQ